MIAHRANIVTISVKRYFTDVGYGATFAPGASICFDDDRQSLGRGLVLACGGFTHASIGTYIALYSMARGVEQIGLFAMTIPSALSLVIFLMVDRRKGIKLYKGARD